MYFSKLFKSLFIFFIFSNLFCSYATSQTGTFPDEYYYGKQVTYSITGIVCSKHPVIENHGVEIYRTYNDCIIQDQAKKICASGYASMVDGGQENNNLDVDIGSESYEARNIERGGIGRFDLCMDLTPAINNLNVDISFKGYHQNAGRWSEVRVTAHVTGREPDQSGTMSVHEWLTSFYIAYWGRAPDPDGLIYWQDMINNGRISTSGAAENFALSPEARAIYEFFSSPHTATDAQRQIFVRSVYVNLLNREPDSSGLHYWVEELRTGRSAPGMVIGHIINAAMTAGATDWMTIRNKVKVGYYFTYYFYEGNFLWNDAARNAAVSALQGVTSDSATVTAKQAWIDELLK